MIRPTREPNSQGSEESFKGNAVSLLCNGYGIADELKLFSAQRIASTTNFVPKKPIIKEAVAQSVRLPARPPRQP